jgi:hypothetical protein
MNVETDFHCCSSLDENTPSPCSNSCNCIHPCACGEECVCASEV